MRAADTGRMTARAAELVQERPQLRLVEPAPAPRIKPWELQSELALVSAEVRALALKRLPERDAYAFLNPAPTASPALPAAPSHSRAVATYALLRLAQTARLGLTCAAALAFLAAVAEVVH
jgi:hypothetical protein